MTYIRSNGLATIGAFVFTASMCFAQATTGDLGGSHELGIPWDSITWWTLDNSSTPTVIDTPAADAQILLGHVNHTSPGLPEITSNLSDSWRNEVTYDLPSRSYGALILDVDLTQGGFIRLNQTQGELNLNNGFNVGYHGQGAFKLTGGTTRLGGGVSLGVDAGSFGEFVVDGPTATVISDGGIGVGMGGNGHFYLGAGNVQTRGIWVGGFGNSSGSFEMTSGTLSVTQDGQNIYGQETIGSPSGATFIQSGGLHQTYTLGIMPSFAFEAGNGTYILNGGTLNVANALLLDVENSESSARFIQNGGINHSRAIFAYYLNNASARYDMNGGLLNTGTLGGIPIKQTGGMIVCTSLINGGYDMSGGGFVLDYPETHEGGTDFNDIRNQVVHGYHNGDWQPTITPTITSSAAAADHRFAIGYAEASDLGVSTFMGQSVDTTSILLRYTYAGDANLDGRIDVADLFMAAKHWNQASGLWTAGDFNYDGFVDILDLRLLAGNWLAGEEATSNAPSLAPLLTSLGLPQLIVPEPCGLSMLAIGFLFRRCRRRGKPIPISHGLRSMAN